jgi:HSP20 family protein
MTRSIRPVDRLESIAERLDDVLPEGEVDTELPSGVLSGVDVDVIDDGDDVVVVADLPGFEKDEISVQADDHRLRVTAESDEKEEENKEFYRRERTQKEVSRTLTLPVEVEVGETTASYEGGVLSVRLPKAEDEMEEGEEIDIE